MPLFVRQYSTASSTNPWTRTRCVVSSAWDGKPSEQEGHWKSRATSADGRGTVTDVVRSGVTCCAQASYDTAAICSNHSLREAGTGRTAGELFAT